MKCTDEGNLGEKGLFGYSSRLVERDSEASQKELERTESMNWWQKLAQLSPFSTLTEPRMLSLPV